MSRLPNRRPAETYKLTLLGEKDDEGYDVRGHRVHVTIGRDPRTGEVRELFFVHRGKSGPGLPAILAELGVKLSRILQGRDPDSGEEIVVDFPAPPRPPLKPGPTLSVAKEGRA